MSVTHPSPAKIQNLIARWKGQEERLEQVAAAMLAGEDWTAHLRGLPLVEEVPPLRGEAYGRDLRGADLRRFLRPPLEIREASEQAAAVVAGITLEAMQNNTPLPGISPFPADLESAELTAVAIRRGETFLLARAHGRPVGVVRVARRVEFRHLTDGTDYAEISGLAVLPDYRRQGIGGRLLQAAEAHARLAGFGWCLLRTTHEVGLVPYYEARGYAAVQTRQFNYADSPTFLDVVLAKSLRSEASESRGLRRASAPSGLPPAAPA